MRPPRRVEENQIARRDFVGFDGIAARAHIGRRARQVHGSRALHDVVYESAAIETAIRRIAAPAIGHADEAHRLNGDFLTPDAVIDETGETRWRGPIRAARRRIRSARTAHGLLRRA